MQVAFSSDNIIDEQKQIVREKCALALVAKYVHDTIDTASEYSMTTPNDELITIPYAVHLLDSLVDIL